MLYPTVPFLLAAGDEETRRFFNSIDDKNLQIFKFQLLKPIGVVEHNGYHRTDAILLKFKILQRSVSDYGSSIFCDADTFILEPFSGPEDSEVGLSHNLTNTPDIARNANSEGVFNAGLIYTSSLDFVNWWHQKYIKGEKDFYEQKSLNCTLERFRTSYFDQRLNYGFWRGKLNNRTVHSFHCHLDTKLDAKMPKIMLMMTQKLRKDIQQYIKKYPKVYEIYNQTFN